MKKNFSEDVYKAYQRLPMAVMKADLWRYCVIYMYGGIYTDADAECMIHPDIFTSAKTLLVCGPENDGIHLCQWCFAAPKHSPIIKSVIDLSVQRILTVPKITGEHIVHYLTGPLCFTDGIEQYLRENNKKTFENKLLYKRYRSNVMCVFDYNIFNRIIRHHFTGFHSDGWKQERDRKLK
jgi:mannosyltransferase OCH1-like enzyme